VQKFGVVPVISLNRFSADTDAEIKLVEDKCKALGVEAGLFELYERPDQKHRLKRFGVAMEVTSALSPVNLVVKGFNWAGLRDGSLVVDVGGGVGAATMALAREFPSLKFVVQDRPQVVEAGKLRWADQFPEGLSTGRVAFQAHDFFNEQPVKDADVFFMRSICHDWSDEYARKILRRLADAAAKETRLICMDTIVPYACAGEGDLKVPGLSRETIPEPLLPNLGGGNQFPYYADILMLTQCNGQERTIRHIGRLFAESGWKLVKVYQADIFGGFQSQIEAIPL